MSELSCSPLEVRPNKSLIQGKHFTTRLLFEPVQTDHLTETFPRVLQLNNDSYLTAKVLFFEKHHPN